MIRESASSLGQKVIRFSVRTLLLFETTVSLYVMHIVYLPLSWSLMNFWATYSLRFVLFVALVWKSISKFVGNGLESLNGKTILSEPLLSRAPSCRLSKKYICYNIKSVVELCWFHYDTIKNSRIVFKRSHPEDFSDVKALKVQSLFHSSFYEMKAWICYMRFRTMIERILVCRQALKNFKYPSAQKILI